MDMFSKREFVLKKVDLEIVHQIADLIEMHSQFEKNLKEIQDGVDKKFLKITEEKEKLEEFIRYLHRSSAFITYSENIHKSNYTNEGKQDML
jgi:tRNA U34 5-carboxymethylaminomethyl modifying GTPase MnmE/TrmE